jgi:7-carboxy-7-deazaguanine synthase
MNLPVNEVFFSIQGEATHTGTPAMFIRTQGCPVGCPFCDTKHTWFNLARNSGDMESVISKAGAPSPKWANIPVEDLVALWAGKRTPLIVITGGEPLLYPEEIMDFCLALEKAEMPVTIQIETSGTHAIPAYFLTKPFHYLQFWVTVSPKYQMPGELPLLPTTMELADELKFPIGNTGDIGKMYDVLEQYPSNCRIWLQPISQDPEATKLCVDLCLRAGFSLSLQTHKFAGLE